MAIKFDELLEALDMKLEGVNESLNEDYLDPYYSVFIEQSDDSFDN